MTILDRLDSQYIPKEREHLEIIQEYGKLSSFKSLSR